MKRQNRPLMRTITALLLGFAFFIVPFTVTRVGVETSALNSASYYDGRRQAIQAQLDKQEEKTAQIQARLSAKRAALADAEELKAIQEEEIASLKAEIAHLTELIASYGEQIREKQEEIDKTVVSMRQSFSVFRKRLIFMHESSDPNYLDFLLQSDNFTDFLSRTEVMNDFFTYDSNLIQKLQSDYELLQVARDEIELLKKESEETLVTCQERTLELQAKIEVLNETIATYEEAVAQIRAEAADSLAQEEKLQSEYDRQTELYEEALRRGVSVGSLGGSTAKYEGSFPCPIRDAYYVSCHYGNGHYGVDLATYRRSVPIYAVESGTVINAECHYSWGNYVKIDHGNGVNTLYAHMTYSTVNKGDTVSTGQIIGYTGSTGNSSGIHLHFEVYVNGTRVNPEVF